MRSPIHGRAATQKNTPTASNGRAFSSQPSSHTVKTTSPLMSERVMRHGSGAALATPRVWIVSFVKTRETTWV
jgi:hypothetical protein